MNNGSYFRRYSLRLIVAAVIIVYAFWRMRRTSQDIRYSIATTTGRISTPRNPFQIEYEFSIGGKRYTEIRAGNTSYPVKYPNGRYYLKFPEKAPGANDIL